MKSKAFTSFFLMTFIALMTVYASLLIVVDPKQTMEVVSQYKFTPFHDNFVLKKRQVMQSGPRDFDTLILGSSTSEVFLPIDVNNNFEAHSFSASSGGGQTPVRFAFFQAALEDFPKLKRVIYIVDLFEFNHNVVNGEFLYNNELQRLTDSLNLKRSYLQFLRYHFSNQILESAFHVIKKYRDGSETVIQPDGTTSRSMILSPVKADDKTLLLDDQKKTLLMKQVDENFYTYSQQVLNQFTELNPDVIQAFNQINSMAEIRGLEVIYILSPYQFDFQQKIQTIPHLKERMQEWRDLFSEFQTFKNVKVLDSFDQDWSTNPLSAVWRDGIHFNRKTANQMLLLMKEKESL